MFGLGMVYPKIKANDSAPSLWNSRYAARNNLWTTNIRARKALLQRMMRRGISPDQPQQEGASNNRAGPNNQTDTGDR